LKIHNEFLPGYYKTKIDNFFKILELKYKKLAYLKKLSRGNFSGSLAGTML